MATSRPARVLVSLAALSLLGWLAAPTSSAQESQPRKAANGQDSAREDASAKRPLDDGERPKKAPDPSTYPRGVTVLIEGWQDPERASDYPRGVTILEPSGRPGRGPRPVVRITIPWLGDAAPEGPGDGESLDEAEGQDLLRAPAEAAREELKTPEDERPRTTVGPSVAEQQQIFLREPHPGAGPLSDLTGWTPQDAWPDRDPGNPYPWNPAEFAETGIDASWYPESAYDAGDAARPYRWNRAVFATPLFDPIWLPTDAWGRTLTPPPPEDGETAAGRGDPVLIVPTPRGEDSRPEASR